MPSVHGHLVYFSSIISIAYIFYIVESFDMPPVPLGVPTWWPRGNATGCGAGRSGFESRVEVMLAKNHSSWCEGKLPTFTPWCSIVCWVWTRPLWDAVIFSLFKYFALCYPSFCGVTLLVSNSEVFYSHPSYAFSCRQMFRSVGFRYAAPRNVPPRYIPPMNVPPRRCSGL